MCRAVSRVWGKVYPTNRKLPPPDKPAREKKRIRTHQGGIRSVGLGGLPSCRTIAVGLRKFGIDLGMVLFSLGKRAISLEVLSLLVC